MPGELLRTILISFSQLIFSSRALALMKAQVSAKTLYASRAGENQEQCGTSRTNSSVDSNPTVDSTAQAYNCDSHAKVTDAADAQLILECDAHSSLYEYNSDYSSDCGYADEDAYAYTGMTTAGTSPTRVPCNSPALTPAPSYSSVPFAHATSALHYNYGHSVTGHSVSTGDSSVERSAARGENTMEMDTSACDVSLVSDTSELEEDEEDDGTLALPTSLTNDTADTAYRGLESHIASAYSGSEDDDAGDQDLFSYAYAPPSPLRHLTRPPTPGVGLGIFGLTRKDGCGEFDGLGVLNLHGTSWRMASPTRSISSSARDGHIHLFNEDYDDYDDSAFPQELSDTFREEALLTFAEDPCHTHSLCPIPESEGDSGGARTAGEAEAGALASASEASYAYSHTLITSSTRKSSTYTPARTVQHPRRIISNSPSGNSASAHRPQRPRSDFSAATYSSSMKRAVSAGARWVASDAYYLPAHAQRARSATWPTRAEGGHSFMYGHGRSPSSMRNSIGTRLAGGSRGGSAQRAWRI